MRSVNQWIFLMKIMVFVLGMCGAAFAGRGPVVAGRREVDVYMVNHATVARLLLYRATVQASELLTGVGVRVIWKSGRPHQEPGCRPVIALTIEEEAPPNLKSDFRAVTRLSNGSITVFYELIRQVLATWPNLAATLLAQVFAHEIGHSLQGLSRHSESGIMKAHWSIADYHAMQDRQLRFSAMDAGLIRAGAERSCPAAQ